MASQEKRRIILLAGPTASGKSAIAGRWAERVGGAVINADSMQVYADLRILTARPAPQDEGRVPHHLYGHVDGADVYSVARFTVDMAALLQALPLGQPLILVGGTGLYLQALVSGLSEVPPVADDVRGLWRARGETLDAAELHRELAARDPLIAGQVRPSDRQRILRALEVIDATGRSLLSWQQAAGTPLIPDAERYCLVPDRAELRERIAYRFQAMIDEGALAEVEALAARRLDAAAPVMKAIGVAPLAAHLRGEVSLAAAVERAITDSRQYAKRQQTWLRNRFADWPVLGGEIPL
jgi:tRNA dimethylallyltransferase